MKEGWVGCGFPLSLDWSGFPLETSVGAAGISTKMLAKCWNVNKKIFTNFYMCKKNDMLHPVDSSYSMINFFAFFS